MDLTVNAAISLQSTHVFGDLYQIEVRRAGDGFWGLATAPSEMFDGNVASSSVRQLNKLFAAEGSVYRAVLVAHA